MKFYPEKPEKYLECSECKKGRRNDPTGEMTPSGLSAFEKRSQDRSVIYSYENQPEKLDEHLENRFRENLNAWTFFTSQAPSYQKLMFYWVMSAKQEATRFSRLDKLIAASESGKKVF